jgi:protein gp37
MKPELIVDLFAGGGGASLGIEMALGRPQDGEGRRARTYEWCHGDAAEGADMSDKTDIGWTDATWTVVQGCDPVSPGCENCYVPGVLLRLAGNPNPKISGPVQGLAERYTNAAGKSRLRFTGTIALRQDRLDWPLQWAKPRKIFIPSHGDLFHEDVPDEFILRVLDVVRRCSYDGGSNCGKIGRGHGQHEFQLLTKRAGRMAAFMPRLRFNDRADEEKGETGLYLADDGKWPVVMKNLWIGVSAEDQERADERIQLLLQTPAAIRFVSCEPLLGPIDLIGTMARWQDNPKRDRSWVRLGTQLINWVIVGGESGKHARPMHPDWARSLRDQCKAAGVPFFFKQWGAWTPGENVEGPANRTEHVAYWFVDGWNFGKLTPRESDETHRDDAPDVYRRATASAFLDGVEHNGFPA